MDREEELRLRREKLRQQGVQRIRPEGKLFHEAVGDDAEGGYLDPEAFVEKGMSSRFTRNLILGTAVVLGLMLVGIWVLIRLSSPEAVVAMKPKEELVTFVERSNPGEVEKAVDEAVRGFMSAASPAERSRFVMGGDEVLPLMEEFYGRAGAVLPNGCAEIPDQMSSVAGGELLIGARGVDLDGREIWLSVISGMDGMLVDWESTVGYGELPWSVFLDERPSEEVLMRVYLLRFIDEKEVEKKNPSYFYRISGKNQSRSLIAEPIRGSEVESKLAEIVPASESHPATVRLRFREGQPFAEITELVHDLWVDTERARRVNQGQ